MSNDTFIGSVQDIKAIPSDIREIYKTAGELDLLRYIKMSADRGHYICHSQSLDLYLTSATIHQLVCGIPTCCSPHL